MKPYIIQSAELNWAVDEASLTVDSYNRAKSTEDYSPDELAQYLNKLISHMHKCFKKQSDEKELIKKYNGEVARLLFEQGVIKCNFPE